MNGHLKQNLEDLCSGEVSNSAVQELNTAKLPLKCNFPCKKKQEFRKIIMSERKDHKLICYHDNANVVLRVRSDLIWGLF
jgi:hypothetical protein